MKDLGSFIVFAAVLLFLLRIVHVVMPAVYPAVLAGPFSLDRVESVAQYAGFAPRLPFYRPANLGERPVNITVSRRPRAQVVIFWQAEHFLRLSEQLGGPAPAYPPAAQPLPDQPQSLAWSDGRTNYVVVKIDDLWIELRTDLPMADVARLSDSLRPAR